MRSRSSSSAAPVMRHVESVRETGSKRSHWKVKGPVGTSLEWDAETINDLPGKMIAWKSLPDASVRNAGSVWFESLEDGVTRVKVAFEIDPPGGAVGLAVAEFLGTSPHAELVEDLARFKEFAEKKLRQSQSPELETDDALASGVNRPG